MLFMACDARYSGIFQIDFFSVCFELVFKILKYISTCVMVTSIRIFSNLLYFAVCFVQIFTTVFLLYILYRNSFKYILYYGLFS